MKKTKSKNSGIRGFEKNSRYKNEYEKFIQKLRKRINTLRTENNFTIEQLAEHELSVRQVKRILNGEVQNFTLAYLFKIAKAFKMKPSELVDV